MTEFSPAWRWAKMTKSQIKRYIKDLEEKRRKAKEKLEKAKKSGEFKKEKQELKKMENLIDDL